MFFRYELTARGVALSPSTSPVVFTTDGIQVTLRLPTEEEQAQGHAIRDTVCVAEKSMSPNDAVTAALTALADDRLPEDSREREEWGREFDYITEDGRILDNYIAPWSVLPQRLQDFLRGMTTSMNNAIHAVVGLVRWRLADAGLHQPFSVRGLFYSLDGESWHRLPSAITIRTSVAGSMAVGGQAATEIQDLLDQGIDEPLGHTLWREAWEQRSNNPRSSLLLAVAALEVGIKQFIAAAVPSATWLVEEAPTPPIERLLRDYLPTLPPHAAAPPQATLDIVKNAVALRNRLVHSGRAGYSYETLETALETTRDLLWKLDKDRGFEWADQHHQRPEA